MKKKILIVDKRQASPKLLGEMLAEDYQVLEAENGEEALNILRNSSAGIAAVILDMTGPAVEGFETLELIRSDEGIDQIPVIAAIERNDQEKEKKALSLGVTDFVFKPYDRERVKYRLENIINLIEAARRKEKRYAAEESLRRSAEQLRIAVSNGTRTISQYDIKTGIYYNNEKTLFSLGLGEKIENVPQIFIDKGLILPECIQDYFDFYDKIKQGEKTCNVEVAMLVKKGEYRWFRCDAVVILDDDEQPSQAIIAHTDITEQREKESVYKKWQQSLKQKMPKSYTLFRSNLSKGRGFDSMEGQLLKIDFREAGATFNDLTFEYASQYVHPDDRKKYISVLNADTLLANYYRDKRMETIEYRETMEDGADRWLRLTIELVEYPNSTDVEVYLMYEDIDEHKRAEIKAKKLAERDPLTGVLNRTAFARQMDQIIEENKVSQHILMMLDIDGFKKLNDVFGHAAGDEELIETARALRTVLRHGDLLGRLGGDEFVICMRDVPYDAVIDKKAKQICSLVRKAYSIDVQISASIGIAVYPQDGENFDTLYRSADAALYEVKALGKDSFAYHSQETEEEHPVVEQREEISPARITSATAKRRMLIVDDNEINLKILDNIFKDEYLVETAKDGKTAMRRLRYYGSSLSILLLDLVMPGMDGFEVLEEMRNSVEMSSIPVIIVSGQDERESSLKALKLGAADYITKPVDPALIRLRVRSAISKAENERLRAQNSYLLLQSSEEAKYRTVLESTGTVVIEYDWIGGIFTYDPSITKHIAGEYNDRRLWHILMSDMVADTMDIKAMQELVHDVANDRKRESDSMMVMLKTPSGEKQWFRMGVFKRVDGFQLTDKMIITYINANEEVLSEQKLRFQAERDTLTGLYSRTAFFEKAAQLISARRPGYYTMACFDINNFKVINDQYGSEKGDEVLKQVAEIFDEGFKSVGGLTCRITADKFAVLYPVSFMTSERMIEIREAASVLDGSIPPISFSIGRYVVDDLSLSVSSMYDRAALAEESIKGRFDVNIAQYDESMRERLLVEQEIVNEMKQALDNNQFEVWFQPQYNHSSGALIGAEALVRWRHMDKGLIPPGEFIPVFERNGFIYELDKYVWEHTCMMLRKWIDEERSPLPVSVNVSRYDLFRDDLMETITGLMSKYDIPIDMLRLEITESAFAKSTDQIISVVKEFIDYGFTVEIDDFGSGYSSFNTLKDVPAQVLKIDMRFLENTKNTGRSGNILESIVRMAKWLGMSVIAEGVEAKEQADYLKSIGCNYIQGYLYARPMPEEEYETLTRSIVKEDKLTAMEIVENLDSSSFWDPKSMDTLIFNTYVGGACIFEWHNERIEILRANDKYAKTIGGENCTIEDALNLVWENHMDDDAAQATRNAILHAIETGDEVTYDAVYKDLFGVEGETWLRTTFRAIARTANRYLLYGTNLNLTAQRKAEQKELEIHERMQAIMDNINSGITAVITRGEEVEYLFVNDYYYEMLGYTREQYEKEVHNTFDLIHHEDRQRVFEAVENTNRTGEPATLEYRVIRRDGQVIWERNSISIVRLDGIEDPVQLGMLTDITAEKLAEEKINETAEQLRFLNDTAGDLLAQTDISEGIDTVLEKVLNYFGAMRSFIYEYNYEEEICANSYEIFASGEVSQMEMKESFPLKDSWYWRETFRGSDFFRYDEHETSDEKRQAEYETYNSAGIKSILAVALRSGGKLIGTMGVDNPKYHLDDYSNLKALGDYMAVILTRRDLTAKIENDRENLQNMMNDTPGGFARLRVLPDGVLAAEYINEPLCRLCGINYEDVMNAENKSIIDTIHPDDIPLFNSEAAEMIATGETSNIKYRLRHMSGSYIPVNAFGRVSRNEEGETFINMYFTDLSEKEKREMSLRETLPYVLSAIMEYSTDLVFAKDKDFRYICCSPAFVKFVGQKTESDIIGRTDYDFFTKEEADHFRSDDVRLLQHGKPLIDYIEPIPSDDGVQHYCRTSKYILRDTEGNIIGMYGIGRDITEERTAFEQLKLLTNSIPGGIASYESSPEGIRITYFNDGYCRMMGYSREEYEKISETGIMNITFEEDKPGLMAQVKALVEEDIPLNYTYRIHTKEGGYIWTNIRSDVPERVGDVCYFNVVLYDVTEQKLATENVHIHEEEMKTAMSLMGKMICEYDPAACVLTVPEAYAALYNLPAAVSGVPDSVIERGIIDRGSISSYKEFYNAIFRGEKKGTTEYRVKQADGTYRWEQAEFSLVLDSAGKPVKAVIAVEDITKQHLQYELEQNRPTLGEKNLLIHALFNLNTGETIEYLYRDGREVPQSERTAFTFGGDNLDTIIINDEERDRYRRLNDPVNLMAHYERGETQLSIDYRRMMPDGEVIWVRNLFRMICEPGGSDILLFEYCYDIEEEKTQELISYSLVSNNYDFILRISGKKGSYVMLGNPDVTFTMPPPQGEDIDVLTRRLVEKNIHIDDREMVLKNALVEGIKRNLELRPIFQFTCREIQQDGGIRYKKFTEYYLDKERDIIIVTREDVTEIMHEETRKNELLEAALKAANEESLAKEREAAAQLRAIMNNVDGGMSAATLVNGVLEYLYVNDEYYSMFGYTKEQFENELPRRLLDVIHPGDLKRVINSAEKSEATGKEQIEFRAYKRDGSLIWIRSISSTSEITGISAPVHISVLIDITKEKEAADNLRMSEEQFRIAATVGGRRMARYDIKNSIYYHDDERLLAMGFGGRVENVPQAFLDAGNVEADCIEEYLEFYNRLRSGVKTCSQDSRFLMEPGSYRWCRQEATVIFDGEGNPSQAIIVISDITEIREKEAIYKKWQQSLQQRQKENYTLFRCNISKNASFDSAEGALLNTEFSPEAVTFNDRTREYADKNIFPEDRDEYIKFLDSDTLLVNYYRGMRIKTLEFREVKEDNTVRWLSLTVELVEYPNSTDVEAYLMYEDIDERKRKELRDKERAETDPLTGVLNRAAFAQAADHMMGEGNGTGSLVLMMLDIDDFKLINDTFGHAMGDQVLIDTAKVLRSALRQGDIVGRLGGDEFLIGLPNMPDDNAIKKKAMQICTQLKRPLDAEAYTSASIGVAVYPRDGKDFETLYHKMDKALYWVKNRGKNSYAFFDESMNE